MSNLPALPALDLDSYRWLPSPTTPHLYRRRTCGAERVAAVKAHNDIGNHEGFIDLVLSFPHLSTPDSALHVSKIAAHVAAALVPVRLAIPSVANTLAYDDDDACWIQNRIPQNTAEVEQWSRARVNVVDYQSSTEEVLERMEDERFNGLHPKGCEAVEVWVFQGREEEGGEGDVHLLVQMNHVSFDGQGWFMVCGAILKEVGKLLEGAEQSVIPDAAWAETPERLELPAGLVLGNGQEAAGENWEEAGADQLTQIMSVSKVGADFAHFLTWGFP